MFFLFEKHYFFWFETNQKCYLSCLIIRQQNSKRYIDIEDMLHDDYDSIIHYKVFTFTLDTLLVHFGQVSKDAYLIVSCNIFPNNTLLATMQK